MIVHRHWLLGLRVLALPAASFLAAAALLVLRHSQTALVTGLLWEGLSLLWLSRNFFDYYLDAWIITDHGIIDLEWKGWFHRQSARILYSDIQGVSYEIQGVLGTLLRYGSVSIEKISTGSAISVAQVPNPRRVESEILRNMEGYLHSKNMKNAKHIQTLLSDFVAGHIQESALKGSKPALSTDEKPVPSRPTKKAFSSSRIGLPKA